MSMVPTQRFLRASVGGAISLRTLEGREQLVAPVIALVEGVIQASNSKVAELVLAQEFGRVPQAWNGRFVMLNHPEINEQKVSANQPEILDRFRIGTVFNARMDGKKLKMDAWIDTAKTDAMGAEAQKLVSAVRRGEVVEVSVGVFTSAEETPGSYNGTPYVSIWRDILPDHLALLPEGTIGACSISMGCGTRAASAVEGEKKVAKTTAWTDARRAALKTFIAAAESEEPSDRDLRMALEQALFAAEPGFLGVVDVFAEAKQVVYAVAPDGETKFFRRDFALAADGAATIGATAEEVKQVTKYEAASAALKAAACGCAHVPAVVLSAPKKEEVRMADKAKTDRATAALTKLAAKNPKLFKIEDATLFAEATEERLAALEAVANEEPEAVKEPAKVETIIAQPVAAATAKPKTEEEYLAEAPESVRSIVASHKAASAARKGALVTTLKAAQKAYTEEELTALDLPQLEKLALIAAAKPDFSAAGTPRVASANDSLSVPTPRSMRELFAVKKSA